MSEAPNTSEMSKLLLRWKDRILHRAAENVDRHMIDGPVEDFTEEQKGFERGLRTAVNEICALMSDPSYWGRSPKHDAELCGCGSDAAWCPYNPNRTEY